MALALYLSSFLNPHTCIHEGSFSYLILSPGLARYFNGAKID